MTLEGIFTSKKTAQAQASEASLKLEVSQQLAEIKSKERIIDGLKQQLGMNGFNGMGLFKSRKRKKAEANVSKLKTQIIQNNQILKELDQQIAFLQEQLQFTIQQRALETAARKKAQASFLPASIGGSEGGNNMVLYAGGAAILAVIVIVAIKKGKK